MFSLRPSAVGVVIYAPSPYPRRWTSPVCSFPSPNLAPLGPKTGWSSQSNEYARNHRGHSHLSRVISLEPLWTRLFSSHQD
jgi:hypothetical protein